MKKKIIWGSIIAIIIFLSYGCGSIENIKSNVEVKEEIEEVLIEEKSKEKENYNESSAIEELLYYEYNGEQYNFIEVDGGDRSGEREANVAVDIGYGEREYWGLTNEYGQLVYVIADEIILQDDDIEPVNSNGRYYDDEAYVPGVEAADLDQGHVIADSLGGVSNAYNITPQDSTLNRYGDQAYMEKSIRDAGGCESFIATITYENEKTQVPSSYKFEYLLLGEKIVDSFDNVNPDKVNEELNEEPVAIVQEKNDSIEEIEPTVVPEEVIETEAPVVPEEVAEIEAPVVFNEASELSGIDTNGNGTVTIAEAKAAGFSMPIYSTDWLYKYMIDRDGDGMVGE